MVLVLCKQEARMLAETKVCLCMCHTCVKLKRMKFATHTACHSKKSMARTDVNCASCQRGMESDNNKRKTYQAEEHNSTSTECNEEVNIFIHHNSGSVNGRHTPWAPYEMGTLGDVEKAVEDLGSS